MHGSLEPQATKQYPHLEPAMHATFASATNLTPRTIPHMSLASNLAIYTQILQTKLGCKADMLLQHPFTMTGKYFFPSARLMLARQLVSQALLKPLAEPWLLTLQGSGQERAGKPAWQSYTFPLEACPWNSCNTRQRCLICLPSGR